MMEHLWLFYYLLGSKFRLMLDSMKVVFQFKLSECISCFVF